MLSFPLRSLVKPSLLIMLSIAWGAMVTASNAFESPNTGPQEFKNQIDRSPANSIIHISCSSEQFKKCVQFCVDSQLRQRGEYSLSGCRSYCRENASSKNGCQ
jgi:hypothetical protein